MKSKLSGSEYILLLKGFREWLELLGYSPLSIPGTTANLSAFLQYQEQNNKTTLEQLESIDANNFITHLQNSIGIRTKKNFTVGHINKHIQSLKLFSRYIRDTGRSGIGFSLQLLEATRTRPVWLTLAEIEQMYEAIENNVLGIRDKAMLAVYYGCGLRLNEGANIELKDIDTSKKVLHVRKGKFYKERMVPIAEKNFEEIKLYIDYGRPQLMQEIKTEALFIDAHKGRKMHRQSIYLRIKKLFKQANITKKAGTHTLRHSIATHLLQSGMKLERIKEFLGHTHLDSTQIYTHIANDTIPNRVRWKNKNSQS